MPLIHPQETDMNRIDPLRAAAACATAGLVLALAACASGNTSNQAYQASGQPVAGAKGHAGCFDPRNARGFAPVGDDVLLVDTGTNHYRVQLDATCFGTDFAPGMQFKGDAITGRICGNFGEKVMWSHHECGIQDVEWITPEEHAALLNPAKKKDTPASN
jgi:hypothetical protein